MLIKGRAFLVVHNRDYADQLARDLDAKGWSCAVAAEEGDHGVSRIRDSKPTAVIIDASRVTDPGIATAAAMRADPATQARPIIFIPASKAVDQINPAVPGAIFASRDALDFALQELAKRPSAS
jgi:DNA-binding response OmpR family regulator